MCALKLVLSFLSLLLKLITTTITTTTLSPPTSSSLSPSLKMPLQTHHQFSDKSIISLSSSHFHLSSQSLTPHHYYQLPIKESSPSFFVTIRTNCIITKISCRRLKNNFFITTYTVTTTNIITVFFQSPSSLSATI